MDKFFEGMRATTFSANFFTCTGKLRSFANDINSTVIEVDNTEKK
jgi:hypothetical protein